MRKLYDTFSVTLTPKAMVLLRQLIEADQLNEPVHGFDSAQQELGNLSNELMARLQRIERGE